MSRAFVKEPEGDVVEELPDRPISTHPNLVTKRGLGLINAEIEQLRAAFSAAQREEDRIGLKAAEIDRDLRYWLARRASAQVVPAPRDTDEVRFGHKVTIERDDGRKQMFQIVGEDEADPKHGLLSHVSPLAAAMFGKRPGATVTAGNTEAEIIAIE